MKFSIDDFMFYDVVTLRNGKTGLIAQVRHKENRMLFENSEISDEFWISPDEVKDHQPVPWHPVSWRDRGKKDPVTDNNEVKNAKNQFN